MGKMPAFQFYVKDWLSDPLLKMVSHQTKGIWIDLLCFLWDSPDRGQLSGSPEQFQKMLGCNALEWTQFMAEVTVTQFANVTNTNGLVTVKNRRMFREEKDRKNTRLRVARFRSNAPCNTPSNANVTMPSSSSSPVINNNSDVTEPVTLSKNHKTPGSKYYKNEFGIFVCSQCQTQFTFYNNLQNHFKEVHK